MTVLDKFWEPVEIAGKSLGDECRAYRMDYSQQCKDDLRSEAGLGKCDCCDYFILAKDNGIVLIEETQLSKTIIKLRNEHHYLGRREKNNFIKRSILRENRTKVYASMLVLCRLCAKHKNIKHLLKSKKYEFWLVASGMTTKEEKREFEYMSDYLRKGIDSVLTRKVVADVKIIPSDQLADKLLACSQITLNSSPC